MQSHNLHKSAHHRTYQISPNTTPPAILNPNSSTYTMQEAIGRERYYGENLNKCPQKIPKNKGAEYSPHTLVPHKSMSNKFAYTSHRRAHKPRKDFSHPFIYFSHTFVIAYYSSRLSIDNLNLVCARARHKHTATAEQQALNPCACCL